MAVASWEDVGVDARTETGTPSAEPRSVGWPGVGLLTIGWFLFVFGVGIALTRAVRWVGGEPLDVGALPMAARFALRGLLLLYFSFVLLILGLRYLILPNIENYRPEI